MAIRTYIENLLSVQAPLPGQVPNSTGGFVWSLGDWNRLERFLILGNEGGTYYASERSLTIANAQATLRCIAEDGPKVVQTIVDISHAGRAPKNDPAILALALCQKRGNDITKAAVREALPQVCRTGTHVFAFAEAVKSLGGWGPSVQKSIARYYCKNTPEKLAYHAIKYQQRNGWSHRDLLRLCHLRPSDPNYDAVYRYMVKGWEGELSDQAPEDIRRQFWAVEKAKQCSDVGEMVKLITDYSLPREAIPSQFLNETAIWEALLLTASGMPFTALLRNLGKMTQVGLLTAKSAALNKVVERLQSSEALKAARIHPLAVLVALRTYAGGHGIKGGLTWTPQAAITNALDKAFYASFGMLAATQKRWMLGIDVSGSMTWGEIAGLPGINPRVAAAAMAMVAAKVETGAEALGFCHHLVPVPIKANMSLDAVCKAMDNLPFGATNPGLLIEHATQKRLPIDVFAVYTDNEVNQGQHVGNLLKDYRQKMGIPARLVVVGFTATDFTIGDPSDRGTLSVVGFDTAAPALMADFVMGTL